MSATYRITRTPVLPLTGDVCPRGRAFGLVGTGAMAVAPSARGRLIQQWAHPSIQVTTNLKAFAASQHPGEDP